MTETIAQKPSTAIQPDMPESSMSSGCIDFILSPEDIALQIARITRGPVYKKSTLLER